MPKHQAVDQVYLFEPQAQEAFSDTHSDASGKQVLEEVELAEFSEKDKPWNRHRRDADAYRDLYESTEFTCYSARIAECSQLLDFGIRFDETGLGTLKLQSAKFCRVRHCPVCQWRRSLMWKARFYKAMPLIMKARPKARYLFLTLTIKNCELRDLRATLAHMNKSWQRLIERKEWPAIGWLRTVEVTRNKADGTAHPHFHVMLMVKPSYFGHAYLSQQRWTELWQSCLRVDYTPVVNVKAIKPLRGSSEGQIDVAMQSAIKETLKYSVKPSDVLSGGKDDQQWLLELTKQLYKTRAIATGGILKDYLAILLEEDPEDLIHADEDSLSEADADQDDTPLVRFGWKEKAKRYAMQSDSV